MVSLDKSRELLVMTPEMFARCVEAAREGEREACARIADEQAHHHAVYGALSDASIVNVVAEAIRSRSVRREQQDHRRRDE